MTSDDCRLWLEAEEFINRVMIPALSMTEQAYGKTALNIKTEESEWRQLQGGGNECARLRETLLEGLKTAKAINARPEQ